MDTAPFINKVANSGLITINPEDFRDGAESVFFDMKDCLFMGLILKEKDFREFIKSNDWKIYQNKNVAIGCSADAIVPTWAYMLLANALSPIAKTVFFGSLEELEKSLFLKAISQLDIEQYRSQRIVVKGCGDVPVPIAAYLELTNRLTPIAKSIMYGEPCSTVPIMKRKD
ncbi:MAG: DUF2480 family protein [Flavobacteriaceae bacterium]|nr:DUF2480 family protein [Flavobacteriaceae bacterium]